MDQKTLTEPYGEQSPTAVTILSHSKGKLAARGINHYFVEFAEALVSEAQAARNFQCAIPISRDCVEQYQSGSLSHIVSPSALGKWVVIDL